MKIKPKIVTVMVNYISGVARILIWRGRFVPSPSAPFKEGFLGPAPPYPSKK